jgi:hypothetical protein
MKLLTKWIFVFTICVSLIMISFPASALSGNAANDQINTENKIGINAAKDRVVQYLGTDRAVKSGDIQYRGDVKSPMGTSYSLSHGKDLFYINQETGEVELAYFYQTLPEYKVLPSIISAEKAEAIAKAYAEKNYQNFSRKNMQMIMNRLYDRSAGGQDYIFGWAEEDSGAYTLNRVYISVNAYDGNIISYLAKERTITTSLTPEIEKTDAIAIAIGQFEGITSPRAEATLSVICLETDIQRLAWLVNVHGDRKDDIAQGGEVLVDALNGEVILFNPFN